MWTCVINYSRTAPWAWAVPVRGRLGLGARYERRPTGTILWPGIFPLAIALHPQPVRHGGRVLMRGCNNRFGANKPSKEESRVRVATLCASTERQWHGNCSLLPHFFLSFCRAVAPIMLIVVCGAAGGIPVSGTRRASRVETCLAMQNSEDGMRDRRVWRAGRLAASTGLGEM